MALLAAGVIGTPQRGNRRYSTPRQQALGSSRRSSFSRPFSNHFDDNDDSDENIHVRTSGFSSRRGFDDSRRSNEIERSSDEDFVSFSGGQSGFSAPSREFSQPLGFSSFSNQRSGGFSSQGSGGFSNQGSGGFSNQGSGGFSNQGSGFTSFSSSAIDDSPEDFSNQNFGISSNQGSGFSRQDSGFSSPSLPGFGSGSGFVSHDSRFSSGPNRVGPLITLLRDDRDGPLNGVYSFTYEQSDGVYRTEQGSPDGPNGAVIQRGSWS